MSALPNLDAIQARADAATEGPWEADGSEVSQHWSRPEPWLTVASSEVACMSYCYGGSARGIERDEDAAFIAAARTDVPVLVAALRAVLALHEDDGHGECSHCPDPSDAHWSAPWPCPTVRAVTAHIDTAPKEKP